MVMVSPTKGAAYEGTSAGIDRVQVITAPPSGVSVTSTAMSKAPVRSPLRRTYSGSISITMTVAGSAWKVWS